MQKLGVLDLRRLSLFKVGEPSSFLSVVAAFFALMFALPGLVGAAQFLWMVFWHGAPEAISWAISHEYFPISLLVLLISALVVEIDVRITAKLIRSKKARQNNRIKASSRATVAEALAEMSQNLDYKDKVKFYEVANKTIRDREGPDFEDFKP